MTVRVRTSGWSYAHWTAVLDPAALPTAQRLDAYVRRFDTVELTASCDRWPRAAAFASWLPPDFLLSMKAPRGLTHARRLSEPEAWVARIDRR